MVSGNPCVGTLGKNVTEVEEEEYRLLGVRMCIVSTNK